MINIIKLTLITILLLIFAGCQQQVQPPLYVWNNYVHSSTDYGMQGHEKEILEKHILELEKIIVDSEEKKQRVAPGIYAEYAQLLYETNKLSDAKKYFLLEKQTYPESSIFIDRVLKKLYGETL
jgi:hypothetical protein